MFGLKQSEREKLATIVLADDDTITVCDCCLRAFCFCGEFMCDDAYGAGTVNRTVAQLRAGKHGESEDYWKYYLLMTGEKS